MNQQPEGVPSFPVRRAFVVQFDATTDIGQGRCAGRVEHVVSGQATHFQTLHDLLTFCTRVLTAVPAALPEEP